MLADGDYNPVTSIFLRGGVVIGLILAGFLVVVLFKKWLSEPLQSGDSIGFTLGDLRKMLERGEISAEEFEKTRSKVIASAQRGPANVKKPPQ